MNAEVVAGIFLFEGFRDWMDGQTNRAADLAVRIRTATGPYRDDLVEQERVAGRGVLRIENRVGGVIEQAEMLSTIAGDVAFWTDRWLVLHPQEDYPGVLAYDIWNPLGRMIAEMYAADEPPRGGTQDRPGAALAIVISELEGMLATYFHVTEEN